MNRSPNPNQAARKACVTTRHAFWLLGLVFLSIGTPAPAQTVPRSFALSLPLFSPLCAWNQKVVNASVQPESDAQILTLYRVLRGNTSDLYPKGLPAPTTWPFMDVNYDDYSIPIFLMGNGEIDILMRDYEGALTETNPKIPMDLSGKVAIPPPGGKIRPAGPQSSEADGHAVLFNAFTFMCYDFWQATTAYNEADESLGGGRTGTTIYEAGAIDYFDTRGSAYNPSGYHSARATGTPLLAGLLVPEDVRGGAIAHALAFAVPGLRNLNTADPYEPPASTTETDYYSSNPSALAAGQRIRLKQQIVDQEGVAIDETGLAPVTRMFLEALRDYGAYVVDNAGGFTFYAEDIHTAVLDMTDSGVSVLVGQDPGTSLPPDKSKWTVVLEKLNSELEQIPFAYGPWEHGQDPSTATISIANFQLVAPASEPSEPLDPISLDGIWKDGPLESPAVTTNFYIQTYTTGSILVVVSADGINGYAFLDDDFSDGVDAFDLGGAGHHLNVGFTSQTEGTGALTLSGSSPTTYDLHRWFPASMVEDYQGIFRHGASVGPGTASYYVQTYETASIMIRSTDAQTFQVFIDIDKTDGMDADAMGGEVHLSCGFTGADEAEGTISFDGGIPQELALSRAFKSPYPPLR